MPPIHISTFMRCWKYLALFSAPILRSNIQPAPADSCEEIPPTVHILLIGRVVLAGGLTDLHQQSVYLLSQSGNLFISRSGIEILPVALDIDAPAQGIGILGSDLVS